MTYETILYRTQQIAAKNTKDNVLLTDAKISAFMLDNCEIEIPEESVFFVRVMIGHNHTRITRQFMRDRKQQFQGQILTKQQEQASASFAYNAWDDFGHVAPGWESIFRLGLPGLKQRILERSGEAANPDFVEAGLLVFEAAQRFCLRAAEKAESVGKRKMAAGLRQLSNGMPRDLYEAFQLNLLYYSLIHDFDGTDVRTLGRLDQLLQPYADKETDPAYVQQLADDYIVELDALKAIANLPFALCGVDKDGNSMCCTMTYTLLKAYAKTKLPDVKLHILCDQNTPKDFLRLCMESIKAGGNSLVFLNNPLVVDGLMKLGQSREDAVGYAIVGCYEASGKEEVPCSCNARVNIPKALEYALHKGVDQISGHKIGLPIPVNFQSFEELYGAFNANLACLAQGAVDATVAFEKFYPMQHSSAFFSASLDSCVEKGGDAYCDNAARYNNSSVCAIGIGTAVDSLYTIRKLVFEEKRLTLQEMIHILDSNWEGQEVLRNYIRNRLPKYGMGNPDVDILATRITRTLSDNINNAPNGRNGVFRLGLFSLDWRKAWGARTAATADGRRDRETLSQNTSATFGMDREGPTGHILSAAAIPGEDAVNGSVLDLELHSSAVLGEHGTDALLATLETFLEKGGQTIHYNVLDTVTLRDAQIHPENHSNLQVRVCGWNALFTHMSKKEQDEFILRSELQAR